MPRVLVVEDNASLRDLYRINLEHAGLEVVEACDGRHALALARRERPDIVLLDIALPGLDGWRVAEALLADSATAELPIVFLSGGGELPPRVAAGRVHVDYLLKPFNPVALAPYLERVLARSRHASAAEERAQRLAEIRAFLATRPGCERLDERAPCE